eukprot:Gregarina_sp_Poly_1__3683@NODE_2087_length_2704_cov_43_003034_g1347_i0_p3_GENE_NODE_2087_length_2704_cov_43_003034_g1347_i0NODE_2087_length_2704_cov_43_003034_g1347_i0_p3_ORF_typecomplete_len136_score16_98YL1/PF05764_13/0_053YL1/PF05764_13/5e02_NODE_2087_length_2704_cov_43_003034_g1347_i09761383
MAVKKFCSDSQNRFCTRMKEKASKAGKTSKAKKKLVSHQSYSELGQQSLLETAHATEKVAVESPIPTATQNSTDALAPDHSNSQDIIRLPPIKRRSMKKFSKEVTLPDGRKITKTKTKTRSRQKNLKKDTRIRTG